MSKESALASITGQPVPVITPPTETPATPTEKPVESDRFAQLSAKEAKLQKEREAVKAELAAINAEKEKLKPVQAQLQQFEELKKTDKLAALKLMGFSEEDIFNFISNQEEPKPPTMEEIAAAAAKKEREEWEKAQIEREQKAIQERDEKNIKAFKDGIGESIKKDAEKYEYMNFYGETAQELVYETILGFMKDDPALTPMDAMKEAMEAVEAHYEEEFTKLMALKKIQSKIKPPVVEDQKVEPTKKRVVQAPTEPVAPKPAARPETTPKPPTRETPSQKKERLAEKLRNLGKTI